MNDRQLSYRALFAVVYTTSVASVYFALGVITHRADGLTPVVLLAAGVFFQFTAMSYAEGASLHRERGGSAMFARYAFNELVSFLAGWSIVLDYTILIAVTALTVPYYLAAFWSPLGSGGPRVAVTLGVIAFVALDNLTGVSARRMRRRMIVTAVDLTLQLVIIVLGLALAFHPGRLSASVHLGSAPTVSNLVFALPVAVIAFTGLEAAANLAGEVSRTPRHVRRLVTWGSGLIVLVYVGIAVVGVGALPVHDGLSALGQRHIKAPLLGVVAALHPHALAVTMKYLVAIGGALGLTAGAGSAMLGVSRTGYSLATNRQIPSGVGRLSPRWGTPWVVIATAALVAAALTLPHSIDFLVGIYAFGALVAFTIAHLSVIALRYREKDTPRRYAVPLSVSFRGGRLPLPAVAGAVLSMAGLVIVLIYHAPARYVGLGWTLIGVALYAGYRTSQDKPLLRRVTIPERALRHEAVEPNFGSILVPVFGTALDDDIIQTAGRLAGETHDDVEEEGAVIEAIWVFEIPLSLPLEAPLPESQLTRAREALARAKLVGEEYEGVEVATATVRSRRAGQAIVDQARRRGVEAIVLAAAEPSRMRGGARLGAGGPLDNYVGEITKYVIRKAPCRVILTAPPANWREKFERLPAAERPGDEGAAAAVDPAPTPDGNDPAPSETAAPARGEH